MTRKAKNDFAPAWDVQVMTELEPSGEAYEPVRTDGVIRAIAGLETVAATADVTRVL